MKEPKHLLIDLLDYIEKAEQLRHKPQFTVPADPFSAYQHEARGLPGITFGVMGEDGEIWMRVERLMETAPPLPDSVLTPWVIVSLKLHEPPVLREYVMQACEGEAEPVRLDRSDFPEIDGAFEKYVEIRWRPWSVDESQRRRTIGLYNNLFALQQRLQAEGSESALEVAWGLGMAVWAPEGKPRIESPIITALVEITIHPPVQRGHYPDPSALPRGLVQ